MGYYTQFKGSVSGPQWQIDLFEKNSETLLPYVGTAEVFLGYKSDGMTWGSWKQDLKHISEEYRFLLFTLEGEGEENDDIWRAFARNGKVIVQQAVIVFPDEPTEEELPMPINPEAQELVEARDEALAKAAELTKKLSNL